MKKIRKLLNSQETIFPDKEFRYLSDVDYQKSSFTPSIRKSQLLKDKVLKLLTSRNHRF